MQFAVFAAEIEQRVAAGFEDGLEDAADEQEMVAAVVDGVAFAFEARERAGEDGRAELAFDPRRRGKAVLALAREAVRGRLLADLEDVDREAPGQSGRAPGRERGCGDG